MFLIRVMFELLGGRDGTSRPKPKPSQAKPSQAGFFLVAWLGLGLGRDAPGLAWLGLGNEIIGLGWLGSAWVFQF